MTQPLDSSRFARLLDIEKFRTHFKDDPEALEFWRCILDVYQLLMSGTAQILYYSSFTGSPIDLDVFTVRTISMRWDSERDARFPGTNTRIYVDMTTADGPFLRFRVRVGWEASNWTPSMAMVHATAHDWAARVALQIEARVQPHIFDVKTIKKIKEFIGAPE